MRKSMRNVWRVVVLTALAAASANAAADWVQIDASEPFVDQEGVQRNPSCSGGPQLVPTPDGPVPVPADTDYSFFFRAGDPAKLAVFFDGGGACWDANTCIGSALLGTPLYELAVDETVASLGAAGGLADFGNPDNPIADYTQVFIPYCSGDLHTGATDTTYFLTLPDGSIVPWTIHHRGNDNVAAVLRWLVDYYANEIGHAPRKAFLSGASAGGYGVLYNYPAMAELLPWHTSTQLMVDAANGVINQDFYERALTPDGVWRVWDNLSPELTSAFSSGPDHVLIEIFKSLGASHPGTRFGQYTTAFDDTQIAFFNIARHVEQPELWFDPDELVSAGFEWTIRARTYMILTALQNWHYRFYLAKGTDHTVIADDKSYVENSARGVPLVDWLDDMINRTFPFGSDWRNVSCTPNCLP
jgi:hypothetical protein